MNPVVFPYGYADFYNIIMEDNYYVDRTAYIRLLEKKGRTLLFLRPRRFGKSLLLSTLRNYYDVTKADKFLQLFGHLAIGQDPTPLHNRFFVLYWDFSVVVPHGTSEQIKQSLYNHINGSIEIFKVDYRDVLPYDIELDPTDGIRTFHSVLAAVRTTPYPLYLMIDEYDNFANEVMMAGQSDSTERYRDLIEGEGILKSLFKAVKYAVGGQGLERVFMTGVSPVVVNDLTSGFNIVKNITHAPDLHALCGFTEAEVIDALHQVAAVCGLSHAQTEEALMMMRTFYNGYRFSLIEDVHLYNPTLVFYFLEHLQERCSYPEEILDSNLSSDRQKILYVANIPHGEHVISTVMSETEALTVPKLAERFGIHHVLYGEKDDPYMASLLYYLGVLTLGGKTAQGSLILDIPNLVVRRLYAEQLKEMFLPYGTRREATNIAHEFYGYGTMGKVCAFLERTSLATFHNRDYRWLNELTIKTLFLSLLFYDTLYIMDSEPSLQRRYADLVMILRPDARQYALFDFVMEFKFVTLATIKKSGAEVKEMELADLAVLDAVQSALIEARTQLQHYRQVLQTTYGKRLRLRSYSVVAIGFERLVWEEVLE